MSTKKLLIIVSIFFIVFFIAVPAGFLYVLNNGNPYTKYLVNKHVPAHLEEMGYAEEQMEEAHYVEPKHFINKDFYHGHYMVVFKDEPNITYYYGLTKKEKHVGQFCDKEILSADGVTDSFEGDTKYSEKECQHSLDNRD
ncbi:DUF3139 domain-containing protein [Oceanobacillus profundus]|uniref:DUF3139 domain-containing protein n=1 Tax=Oceanobacillus TaxID=182709 RepID=UPI0026E1D561|nr:DUF3139 domain-containing protein [Oceanobacillus profundus]MDO6448504.1 DUF3139 domain-containing protein [Oceanobacillus profundus]